MKKDSSHSDQDITRAATLFFTLRGLLRNRLAAGRRIDPYAWLHVETLVYIRDHTQPSMSDLAAHFSITAPSATSLVNALTKDGLVVRKPDSHDKRTTRLSLTKKGRALLAKSMKHGVQVIGALFAPLSKPELATFSRSLERIIAAGQE